MNLSLFIPQRWRFLAGLVLATSVLLINQAFIQYFLRQKRQDATVINLAGRQRMLCQKLTMHAYQVQMGHQDSAALQYTLKQLTTNHWALLQGDSTLGISPLSFAVARERLLALTPSVEQTQINIDQYLAGGAIDLIDLGEQQHIFLGQMDQIVGLLESHANGKLERVIRIEIILLIISLLVIGLEVRYIYQPMYRALKATRDMAEGENAKFKALLHSSTNGTLLLDMECSILNINLPAQELLEKLLGYPVGRGDYLSELLPEYLLRMLRIGFERTLRGTVTKVEWKIPDGMQDRWVLVSFFPVFRARAGQLGVGIHMVDIQEQKSTEYQLLEQNHQLHRIADRQSHDLRRPLTSVMGLLELIEMEKDPTAKLTLIHKLKGPIHEIDEVIHEIVAESQKWATAS
ncbi:MAG: type IV pili methyl-accepting chemotaxis transducer N-terminal domain-containing protein [Bacteroidota bacterium]